MKISPFIFLACSIVLSVCKSRIEVEDERMRVFLNTVENKQDHLDLYYLLKTAHAKVLL